MKNKLMDSLEELAYEVGDAILIHMLQDYYDTMSNSVNRPHSSNKADYLDELRMLDSISHVLSHYMCHSDYIKWKAKHDTN